MILKNLISSSRILEVKKTLLYEHGSWETGLRGDVSLVAGQFRALSARWGVDLLGSTLDFIFKLFGTPSLCEKMLKRESS